MLEFRRLLITSGWSSDCFVLSPESTALKCRRESIAFMKLLEALEFGLLAILLYELAHVAVALTLKVKVYQVGISWKGVYLRRERGTPRRNLAIAPLPAPLSHWALRYWSIASVTGFALMQCGVVGLANLLPLPASGWLAGVPSGPKFWRIDAAGRTTIRACRGHFRGPPASTRRNLARPPFAPSPPNYLTNQPTFSCAPPLRWAT